MKIKKLILPLILPLILIIILPLANAFSMSPGTYQYEYDEINGLNEEFGFQLKSRTSEPIVISVEKSGSLKEYLEVDTDSIELDAQESKIIPMKLSLPANLDEVGKQKLSVIFTKKVLDDKGNFMAVTTAYRANIIITFAYPGEYVNIIDLKPKHVNEGKNTTIDWKVQARGTNTSKIINELTITDSKNETIFFKNHTPVMLDRNEIHTYETQIPSKDYLPGTYNVTLKSHTANNFDEKSQTLKIGEEDIKLKNFSPKNFTVGNIVEFSINLENLWGAEFKNVYATLNVNDTQTTTKSIKLPEFTQSTIDSQYINLAHLEEGKYTGTLTVYFDNNVKEFDINLTAIPPNKQNNQTDIITITITSLMLVLIIILVILFKKHNPRTLNKQTTSKKQNTQKNEEKNS